MRGWIFPESGEIPSAFCCFDSSAPTYSAMYSSNSFMVFSPGGSRLLVVGTDDTTASGVLWVVWRTVTGSGKPQPLGVMRGNLFCPPHPHGLSAAAPFTWLLCFSAPGGSPAPGDGGEWGVWASLPIQGSWMQQGEAKKLARETRERRRPGLIQQAVLSHNTGFLV